MPCRESGRPPYHSAPRSAEYPYTPSGPAAGHYRAAGTGQDRDTRTPPGRYPEPAAEPTPFRSLSSTSQKISDVLNSRRGQVGRDDDVPLLDLAGRALGQHVDNPYVPRILVGRDLALDVVPQFRRADVGTWLECHRGGDLLAQDRVRQADHGGLGDFRVLVEHLLDLPRVDVVAAAMIRSFFLSTM